MSDNPIENFVRYIKGLDNFVKLIIVVCIIVVLYFFGFFKLFTRTEQNKDEELTSNTETSPDLETEDNEFLLEQASNMNIKKKIIKKQFLKNMKVIGKPTSIENNSNGEFLSATWQLPLDKVTTYGYYKGLDLIKLNNYIARKRHPHPAPVYIIAGKYINVPEHLYGPLKYASPTINIELLQVPKEHNTNYENTGTKTISLVTGSCASVTISAITIKFAEDMIDKYSDLEGPITQRIFEDFRNEYDLRVLRYLCGQGLRPAIGWFKPTDFGETDIIKSSIKDCDLKISEKTRVLMDNEKMMDEENKNRVVITSKNIITSGSNTKDNNDLCKSKKIQMTCEKIEKCYWDGQCKAA